MSNDTRYRVARSGNELGQFTLAEIRDGLKSGKFTTKDHYWGPGMAAWASLADLPKPAESAPSGAPNRADADMALAELRLQQAAKARAITAKTDDEPRCNAIVFVMLGIVAGMIGMHNFYIGRTGRAWVQIVLTLSFVGLFFNIPWVLYEIAQVRQDAAGRRFIGT